MMIGSNNPDIYFIPTVDGDKVDRTLLASFAAEHDEIAGQPTDNKICVIKCRCCGQLLWSTINGHVCPACKILEVRERSRKQGEERKAKRAVKPQGRVTLTEEQQAYADEENLLDSLVSANNRIIEQNSKVLCPFYNNPAFQSTWCACCKRGVNWNSGTQDVSDRRCPDHPISASGKRCILRTTYRKDTHSPKGYTGGEVIDYSNLSEDSNV